MSVSYRKKDDQTLEATTVVDPQVILLDRAEIQTKIDHWLLDIDKIQTQIDEAQDQLTLLKG